VALVQPPRTANRQPWQSHLGQRDLSRLDRSRKQGGMNDVWPHPRLVQKPTGVARLLPPEIRERHVDPARESALEVPGALSVTQQDQSVRHHF